MTTEFANAEQFRGVLVSKRRYFYGLRAQAVGTLDGLPVEFVVMPGALSDLQGLAELPLSLPEGSDVALEAAYTEYSFEDFALEVDQVRLLVTRKRSSQRRDVPALSDYKLWLRHSIEKVFGEISKLFLKENSRDEFSGIYFDNQFFCSHIKLIKRSFNNSQLWLI